MSKKAMEFKIGLFVLVGIAVFLVTLMSLEVVDLEPKKELRVLFNYTSGLQSGAPVQLAGVPVGEVEKINLLKDVDGITRVEVIAKLRQDIEVEPDAEIRIGTHGLLGNKYLEILPGSGVGEPTLSKESLYQGFDPVMLDKVVITGERIAQKMEKTVDTLNELMDDKDLHVELRDNVRSLSSLLKDLRQATDSVNIILNDLRAGRGLMGKLLTDEELYENLNAFVKDVKKHPWKLLKKR